MSLKGQTGMVRGIFIPILENKLYEGEKALYLDMTGFEISKEKKGDRKDTHLVKQSFAKEVYDAMTEEQRKEVPILGNHVLWGFQEPAPNEFKVEAVPEDEGNDLPF